MKYLSLMRVQLKRTVLASHENQCALDIIDNHDQFSQIVQRDCKEFKPMGTKVGEYRVHSEGAENSIFEFYQVNAGPNRMPKRELLLAQELNSRNLNTILTPKGMSFPL